MKPTALIASFGMVHVAHRAGADFAAVSSPNPDGRSMRAHEPACTLRLKAELPDWMLDTADAVEWPIWNALPPGVKRAANFIRGPEHSLESSQIGQAIWLARDIAAGLLSAVRVAS